jgi:hypothetical protein
MNPRIAGDAIIQVYMLIRTLFGIQSLHQNLSQDFASSGEITGMSSKMKSLN